MAWSKKVESILSIGISLHNTGVYNWALSKEQALCVLDKFESEKIAVLGGDVYELNDNDGEWEHNYDNWYCDREMDESFEKYVIRSINKTRAYISNYSSLNPKQVMFSVDPG